MTFIVLAGGVALCAVIAAGSAVAAARERRWRATALWLVMAVPLLAWAGNLAATAYVNPALLSDAPPGGRR